MKFATVARNDRHTVALVDERAGRLWPVGDLVTGLAPGTCEDMVAFIRAFDPARIRLVPKGEGLHLDEVSLEAPIMRPPRNIMCVGKNYRDHAREFSSSGFDRSGSGRGDEVPEVPIFFTKPANTILACGRPIPLEPGLDQQVDYEVELAVVIGKVGKRISRDRAFDHVWGYTIINDVTARDLQARHRQWFLGKSLDGFCPMGPWIATADELDAAATRVRCYVNGEIRQDASTRDLIFDIPTLIETLSAGMTLEPGDIIATGTPAGVGIGLKPPRFLHDGDEVVTEIEGIGRLVNRVQRSGDMAAERPTVTRLASGSAEHGTTGKRIPMLETINGKPLAVESCGSGPPLIMVHGLGGTSNSWAPQVAALMGRFSIMVPDLDGSGRSPCSGAISIASHVADIVALMDSRGIDKAHFAGHSMGTIVCQHLAAQHPERVLSLALMGPFPEPPPPARQALKDRADKARSEGMVPIADAILATGTSADTKANQPAAAAYVRESLMRQDPEGYACNCEALAEATAADLGRIDCPALLITGDEDKVAPAETMQALASGMRTTEQVVLTGCGHWTTIERPKQVNYAMARFYNEVA